MNTFSITKREARKIILHAAGLTKQGQFGKTKESVYKVINHLGFLQVDSNYTVERAHHHMLFSRIPSYKTHWLDELQSDQRIYEFWTRDAGYMPIDEFRFSMPIHDVYVDKCKGLPRAEINLMNNILDRIGRDGPMRAKDFEADRTRQNQGWWDWRPSKMALERLHLTGKLLATRQKDFHKVYDLTDNIVPGTVDRTKPTHEELARHLILRALKALGIAQANEIAWNGRIVKPPIKEELKKLVHSGEVYQVEVEGLKGTYFMLSGYHKKKITIAGDMFILSPFDMLCTYRKRLKDFFDFDYQIECFVPEKKRKYGYFSLPILAGDTFIARMDSKADRKEQTLVIHNLYFEPVKITNPLKGQLQDAVQGFAEFNGCDEFIVRKSNQRHLPSI